MKHFLEKVAELDEEQRHKEELEQVLKYLVEGKNGKAKILLSKVLVEKMKNEIRTD